MTIFRPAEKGNPQSFCAEAKNRVRFACNPTLPPSRATARSQPGATDASARFRMPSRQEDATPRFLTLFSEGAALKKGASISVFGEPQAEQAFRATGVHPAVRCPRIDSGSQHSRWERTFFTVNGTKNDGAASSLNRRIFPEKSSHSQRTSAKVQKAHAKKTIKHRLANPGQSQRRP